MTTINLTPPAQAVSGQAPTEPQHSVQAFCVRKAYGQREVLRGISLEVGTGEVFGILGPNGAGKTTLVECLVGLRRPDSGEISVLGMDPATTDRRSFTSRVSVQPQDASLFENVRVREALDLFASFHARPYAVDDVLGRVGLGDSQRQLVRKLSGGQRRRLLLGVAMIGAPELIVLDEPSAGLDPVARRSLWSVITDLRASGTTVLLTTHHMDEATVLCDRVAFIVDGQVRAIGAPADLVQQVAAGQTVSFHTRVDTQAVVAVLRAQSHVSATDVEPTSVGHRITVQTTNSDMTLRLISRHEEWSAHGITVDAGDLESVFLSVAESDTPPPNTTSRSRFGRKERRR